MKGVDNVNWFIEERVFWKMLFYDDLTIIYVWMYCNCGEMRSWLIALLSGSAIMCHRCVSAMGGCGDDLDWRMFPWRDCGDSEFCVKIIKKVGST